MDLPAKLPCYNCGRTVDRDERELAPSLGLPELPPAYYAGATAKGAMGAIGQLGRSPPGVHFEHSGYERDLKQYITQNWWCKNCYSKKMKELEERRGR